MEIRIVDGNPAAPDKAYERKLEAITQSLKDSGNNVSTMRLAEKNIHGCTGCFSCWLKTPGVCVFDDDGPEFLRSLIHSDLLLFASPLVMGFPSALLKNAIDRFIPMALPFIEMADGECRHPMRYESTPPLALLYDPEPDTDEEDIDIVSTVFKRFARNAHTRFLFSMPLSADPTEASHEIENI